MLHRLGHACNHACMQPWLHGCMWHGQDQGCPQVPPEPCLPGPPSIHAPSQWMYQGQCNVQLLLENDPNALSRAGVIVAVRQVPGQSPAGAPEQSWNAGTDAARAGDGDGAACKPLGPGHQPVELRVPNHKGPSHGKGLGPCDCFWISSSKPFCSVMCGLSPTGNL